MFHSRFISLSAIFLAVANLSTKSHGFSTVPAVAQNGANLVQQNESPSSLKITSSLSTTALKMSSEEGGEEFQLSASQEQNLLTVRNYLQENYPAFYLVLEKNDSVWKTLGGAAEAGGFTIFVPNAQAFETMGNSKKGQLLDPRNLETTEKIGAYHVIGEVVTADDLYNSGGVVTLGGEVVVDRSTSGGFFGVGGKEDGGVMVGSAKVVQSMPLGSGILHETDGFVNPSVMWRYMDQLRIPGSN